MSSRRIYKDSPAETVGLEKTGRIKKVPALLEGRASEFSSNLHMYDYFSYKIR